MKSRLFIDALSPHPLYYICDKLYLISHELANPQAVLSPVLYSICDILLHLL